MSTCEECGAADGAHYGTCSLVPPEMRKLFDELDAAAARPVVSVTQPDQQRVVMGGWQQGKTLELARRRVRLVAEGGTINGTYRLSPEPALEAFRADLLLILGGS